MQQNSVRSRSSGFTLLEMLVVLVILGLTSAIVFPRLTTVAASFDFALKREALEQTLNALSYQAFRDNQDIVLSGAYIDSGRVPNSETQKDSSAILKGNLRTRSLIAMPRDELPPLNPRFIAPQLPEGWRLVVDEPIYFRSSGYCAGGRAELFIGRAQYAYQLAPPLCHAVLVE